MHSPSRKAITGTAVAVAAISFHLRERRPRE